MRTLESVCVYCGSSDGRDESYFEAGRTLGRALAGAGLRLVYGAGTKGVMGALAQGVKEAGGTVTGIIPRFLIRKESSGFGLSNLDEVIVTEDMHQRKHLMFERSDAFIALPGGIGTLEEIVEILTWAQLARHEKPIMLVNIGRFWNPLLDLLDHMKAEGFIHSQERVRPLVVDSAEAAVPALLSAGAAAPDAPAAAQARIDRM